MPYRPLSNNRNGELRHSVAITQLWRGGSNGADYGCPTYTVSRTPTRPIPSFPKSAGATVREFGQEDLGGGKTGYFQLT